MELKWLEDLLVVAELRNFSKAATARNTTQPALSRHIRALELWYGVSLVDRSSYPVTLTSAGEAFVPIARHIVSDLHRHRREARAAASATGSSVVFAMPHALASQFFPAWWRQRRLRRDLQAKVVAADFDDCVELLIAGACQYMLCYSQEQAPLDLSRYKLRHQVIARDHLRPYSGTAPDGSALYPLLRGTTVPLLAYDKGSYLGRITSALYPRVESVCVLKLQYESSLVEALKAEVMVGEGVAWLPEKMMQAEHAAGRAQPVGIDEFAVPLQVLLICPDIASQENGPADLTAFFD